ncbi:cache domain-containing protein [Desulfogranum marinum]|uniref:cache domain-containing protein n=1 Tax=Desulfogranum marinum TaxID=453220 RepID=UPI0029C85D2B|nr:cache domain-containing protein [Desulfogranum marinum]
MKKPSLIKTIRTAIIFTFIALAVILIVLHTLKAIGESKASEDRIRRDFIEDQRRMIKGQVDRVVNVIDDSVRSNLSQAKDNARYRVNEAAMVALSIYNQLKGKVEAREIESSIIEALRPIRFDNELGYYFICDVKGFARLIADNPELEGKNLIDLQDESGRYIVRDMIGITQTQGEGYYTYNWTKPNETGRRHRKISYVKYLEPLGWYIGAGVYLDKIETCLQQIIADYVTMNRFGPNNQGYVFINEILNINGGKAFARVYANPNRPNDTGKLISDDYQDAKGKMFRREFLKGLREYGECYVDYWYRKLDVNEPRPKTSYFKLAADGRFMVAAGVYLDDVDEEIEKMHATLRSRLKKSFFIIGMVFLGALVLVTLLFNKLSKKVENDFRVFSDFFKRAATTSDHIAREKIMYGELDLLADSANRMLDDKMEVEEQLRNERERLRVTLHSIGDGVIATDTKGTILLMNGVAVQLTGWTVFEAIGRHVNDIMVIKQPGKSEKQPVIDLDHGKARPERVSTLVSRSGNVHHIAANSSPISGDKGDVLGKVIVFRDETENLRIEEELFKAQKLESVGFLAGGIAHDFNNILAGIFGNIELAKKEIRQSDKAFPYIQMAHESLQRAKSLTSQLLTFAKGGDPIIETVDLKQMIREVVSFNLSGSPVRAEYDIPENIWPVHADDGQISQVIANLVINAKQAMTSGGTLTIRTANVEAADSMLNTDSVRLEIEDTGTGMAEDVVARIFDPYFSTKETGRGLGLSMVHSIVEKHLGRICVDSTLGKGTVFVIYLPAEKTKGAPPVENAQLTEEIATIPQLKILVVDDDEVVQLVLSEMLQLLDQKVEQASEGEAGIQKYIQAFRQGIPYDIILQDLTLPGGKGGKETAQEILAFDPKARIIAISGYANDPIMAQYRQYGFSGRIAKPFKLRELEKEIMRVFNL